MHKNKEQFYVTTGLTPDCFIRLFEYVNPEKDCINIKLYNVPQRFSEEKYRILGKVKSGLKRKPSAKDQLFMYLCGLMNRFTLLHISFLFQTPKVRASRYIITWTNFWYISLGSIPICPSPEKINEN